MAGAPGTKLNMVESGAMKVDCLGLSKFNSNPIASNINRRVPFSCKWIQEKILTSVFLFYLDMHWQVGGWS